MSRPTAGAPARIGELAGPGAGEGLTETEAAARLARYGPNALPEEHPHLLRALIGKLMGPVPWLLEAAVVLELAAGKVTEAVIVACLAVFNAVLSFLQEGRARDALTLLRSRLAFRARVRRDGRWQLVDAERLVPGDLVHVRVQPDVVHTSVMQCLRDVLARMLPYWLTRSSPISELGGSCCCRCSTSSTRGCTRCKRSTRASASAAPTWIPRQPALIEKVRHPALLPVASTAGPES